MKLAWQQLTDLPFAAALVPHAGGLSPEELYDGVHFDQAVLDAPDASGSRFLECAFTGVTVSDGRLGRAEFSQVWLHDARLLSTSLARTGFRDATLTSSALAGVEAFGSRLRRVRFDRCKLDSVNFRDCDLTDVTFDACMLRGVDFSQARLTRVSFPGCRLADTTLTKVTLDKVDLRGAELGLTVDPPALRGAIVTTAQLIYLAPLLAASIGIVVTDSARS